MLEGITLFVDGGFLCFLGYVWCKASERIEGNGRRALVAFGAILLLNVVTLVLASAD